MEKADVAALKLIEDRFPSGNRRAIQHNFFRLIEGKPGNKTTEHVMEEWESSYFTAPSLPTPPHDEKPKRGRLCVNLSDQPCKKKERLLLREMVEAVERFSQKQNISKEEALRMTVNECHRTWHTPDNQTKCPIPVVDAAALLYNVNLSTSQYQMIRTVCLDTWRGIPC